MFVSRENFRNQGEIRGEKSGGERRETERKKEKNLDSGASVVLGCRREEEKREKIAVQRERERERVEVDGVWEFWRESRDTLCQ